MIDSNSVEYRERHKKQREVYSGRSVGCYFSLLKNTFWGVKKKDTVLYSLHRSTMHKSCIKIFYAARVIGYIQIIYSSRSYRSSRVHYKPYKNILNTNSPVFCFEKKNVTFLLSNYIIFTGLWELLASINREIRTHGRAHTGIFLEHKRDLLFHFISLGKKIISRQSEQRLCQKIVGRRIFSQK